jgi:hypothetical protein
VIRTLIALCVSAFVATGVAQAQEQAQPVAPTFDVAVETYGQGGYALAMEQFARLAEQEPDAGRRSVLHANAGTAAARAEQWGEATWHLEAAWRIDPGDPHVRRNLEQVRVLSGAGEDESPGFLETLIRLPLMMTEAAVDRWVGWIAAAAILLLAACRARLAGRRTAWIAVVVGAGAVGLALGSDAARAWDARRAVVIEGVAVRAEPTPEGRVLFRLPPGAVVRDEEQRDAWRLLETPAGARGWAPVEQVRGAGS